MHNPNCISGDIAGGGFGLKKVFQLGSSAPYRIGDGLCLCSAERWRRGQARTHQRRMLGGHFPPTYPLTACKPSIKLIDRQYPPPLRNGSVTVGRHD